MSNSLAPSLVPALYRSEAETAGLEPPESYFLDNAAVIMPPITNDTATSLYHLAATMDAPVDVPRLQEALNRTARRFPYLVVELRRGFFWYRLVPLSRRLLVEPEPKSPCQGFDPNVPGSSFARVYAKDARISIELSHIAADGKGGMRFLKTLVAEYCRLSGSPAKEAHPDVYDLSEAPDPEEYEDAYIRHSRPGLPLPVMGRPAFRIPGRLLPKGDYRVTVARYPLAAALAAAKARGVTLTELATAVYVEALQEIWLESGPKERRRDEIAVEVPVDMRRFFPTKTNRNFTLFTIVGEDLRLGRRSFEDILERTRCRFRLECDEASISRQITRNVHGLKHPLVRALPLRLKDIGAKILFRTLGEDYVSGIVTNLGAVDFPKGVAERVLRFDLAQPPSDVTRANVAIHSYSGELYVTVCSLAEGRRMEGLVYGRLASLGLEAPLECNLED